MVYFHPVHCRLSWGFIQVHKLPFAHVLDMPEADQLLVQYILNSQQTHETNLQPYPWTALFGLPLTTLPSTTQRLLLSCLPGVLFLNRKCFSLNPQQLVTFIFYNQYIYIHSLFELCSKIIFGIVGRNMTCPSLHARENRITDLFSGLIGPPFPVDLLHHIRNKCWQAADQHFNRKMDYCMAFILSYVMYALHIVQIRCTLSIVVMVILRDVFVPGHPQHEGCEA